MRIVLFGLVSIIVGSACGKKVEAPVAVDAAVATETTTKAEPDSAAPAADTAAPAPDTAPAPASDVAAVAPDAAPVDAAPADEAAATPDAVVDAVADAVALPEPTPPPKPFHDMTEIEQKQHMKQVVLPVMRARFQQFDPEEFAKVNCATCHGKGAMEGKFEMPNPELTKLPKTHEGFLELAKTKAKALDFMGKVVMPAMATMMGEPPFDPATGKGFGCFECHTAL